MFFAPPSPNRPTSSSPPAKPLICFMIYALKMAWWWYSRGRTRTSAWSEFGKWSQISTPSPSSLVCCSCWCLYLVFIVISLWNMAFLFEVDNPAPTLELQCIFHRNITTVNNENATRNERKEASRVSAVRVNSVVWLCPQISPRHRARDAWQCTIVRLRCWLISLSLSPCVHVRWKSKPE